MSEKKWINCPLCGETDMSAVYDEPDLPPVVTCTNLGCPSNTGDLLTFLLWTSCDNQHQMAKKLAANTGYELVEQRYDYEREEEGSDSTLRDRLAMAALTGMLANNDIGTLMEHGKIVADSYKFADLALKERDK